MSSRERFLQHHPWLPFVLPYVVFLLVGTLEPTPQVPGGAAIGLAIPYDAYPWVYAAKLVLTLAALLIVWPGYRQFPVQVTLLGVLVGVLGAVLWIGLAEWRLEERLVGPLGLGRFLDLGRRSGFDPWQHLHHPAAIAGFLALRFLGLVAVVPVIEEFFLRGFVMRFVIQRDWWKVPIGQVTWGAAIVGTLVPMATHPAELLAAAVWFSLITWLLVQTKSLWDCVAAHAVTNVLLGLYTIYSGHWWLW